MTDFLKISLIVFGAVAVGSVLLSLSYIIAYQQYLIKKVDAQPIKHKMPHYRWIVVLSAVFTIVTAIIVMSGAFYESRIEQITQQQPYAMVVYECDGEKKEIKVYEDSSYTELPAYGPNDDLCDFSGWYFDTLFTASGESSAIQYNMYVFDMLKGTQFTLQLYPRWETPERQKIYIWEELSKTDRLYQPEAVYIYSPYGIIKNVIAGYYDFMFEGIGRDVIIDGVKYVSVNGGFRIYLGEWGEGEGHNVTFITKTGTLCDDIHVKITLAEIKDGDIIALAPGMSAIYKMDIDKGVYKLDTSNEYLGYDGEFIFNDTVGPVLGYNNTYEWMIPNGYSVTEIMLGAYYMGYPINYIRFTNFGNEYYEGVLRISPVEEAVTMEDTMTAPIETCKFFCFTAAEYGRYSFLETGISSSCYFYDSNFNRMFSVDYGLSTEGYYNRIVLEEGETVHIQVYNAYQNINITVQRSDSPFVWYVNGELVCHSANISRSDGRPQVSVFYNGIAVKARVLFIENYIETIHESYPYYIIYKVEGFSPSSYPAGTRVVLKAYEETCEYSEIELFIVE